MNRFSFHATIQGAVHVQNDLECQDASGSCELPNADGWIFAIADGHGDPDCMRSAMGSRMAVDVAIEHLEGFALEYKDTQNLLLDPSHRQPILSNLAQGIVRMWQERANADCKTHPLSQEAWDSLSENARVLTRERPARLYGTTLVAGLRLADVLVLVQQGDGCCVVLDEQGTAHLPMPEDPRCLGNMTTSMCDSDAAESIRAIALNMRKKEVCACFVGSDGVDKSLRGTEGLFDFCTEVALDALGSSNARAMQAVVSPSLAVLSEQGSGDDTSLAGYVDVDRVAACAQALVGRHEQYQIQSEQHQLSEQLKSMQRMHDWYCRTEPAQDDGEERQKREQFFEAYHAAEQRLSALNSQQDSIVQVEQEPSAPVQQEEAVIQLVAGAAYSTADHMPVASPAPPAEAVAPTVAQAAPKPAVSVQQQRKRGVSTFIMITLMVVSLLVGVALGHFVLGSVLPSKEEASAKKADGEVQQDAVESDAEEQSPMGSFVGTDSSQDEPGTLMSDDEDAFEAVRQYCLNYRVLSGDEEGWQYTTLNSEQYELYNQCFEGLSIEPIDNSIQVLGDAALAEVTFRCGSVDTSQGYNADNASPSKQIVEGSVVLCARKVAYGWEVVDGSVLNEAILEMSGFGAYMDGQLTEGEEAQDGAQSLSTIYGGQGNEEVSGVQIAGGIGANTGSM